MSFARFRFYAELNDFLPPHRRQAEFSHLFHGRVSVKDMIESLGVPHTEVDLILANGASVGFSYRVQNKDRLSVYPMFESLDIRALLCVRPEPLRETKFVLDIHLGRLAAYLRMVGFDALYRNDSTDKELAQLSSEGRRILLTRDRGLLKRSLVTHGYCVRETYPGRQLLEILHRFDLFESLRPFSRCLKCNELLVPADKDQVAHRSPPHPGQTEEEFQRCRQCDRVYWKGSHYRRMTGWLESLLAAKNSAKNRRFKLIRRQAGENALE